MTIYALSYRRAGQDVTERFESMTARALRLIGLGVPIKLCRLWLESADVEARNEAILGAVERVERSA